MIFAKNMFAKLGLYIRQCGTALSYIMYWHWVAMIVEMVWQRWRQKNCIIVKLLWLCQNCMCSRQLRPVTAWRLHTNCIFKPSTTGAIPLTIQTVRAAVKWLATSQTMNRNIYNFLVLPLFVFYIVWWHNMITNGLYNAFISLQTGVWDIKSHWLARNLLVLS